MHKHIILPLNYNYYTNYQPAQVVHRHSVDVNSFSAFSYQIFINLFYCKETLYSYLFIDNDHPIN